MFPDTDLLFTLQIYAVLSHGAATLGKVRPASQKTRSTNMCGTILDFLTYVATFMFLYTQALTNWSALLKWLVLLPTAIGGIMHFIYVCFQLSNDKWYKQTIDNYTAETITHGPILKAKMIAAAVDTLFHLLGLTAIIICAAPPLYVMVCGLAIGYLFYNILWEQPRTK